MLRERGRALMAAAFVLGALGGQVPAGEVSNLMPNGGFENGTQGWYWEQWRGKTEPGHLDRENPYKGRACYRMTVPGRFGERRMNAGSSPIEPGWDYEFSVALSCRDMPPSAVAVRILQYGTEKTEEVKPQGWVEVPSGSGRAGLVETGGTHGWKEFKVLIPAASIKASTSKLSVFITRKEIGLGVLGIDEVRLVRGKWVGVAEAPAKKPPDIAASREDAPARRTSEKNLLAGDTSFETGLTEWPGGTVDATTAAHGTRSLVLSGDNPRHRGPKYYQVIEPQRRYTFSFNARTDRPGSNVVVDVRHLRYKIMRREKFTLSSSWKRYRVEVPPQDTVRSVAVEVTREATEKVWLDALQLEEGDATDYRPSEPLSVKIGTTGEPANMLLTGKAPVRLAVGLYNARHGSESFTVSCATTDYYGREVMRTEREVPVKRGGAFVGEVGALSSRTKGFFVTNVIVRDDNGNPVKEATVSFGVVSPPVIEGDDPDSFFGLHGGVSSDAMHRIGVKWIRNFRQWIWFERRKGQISLLTESWYEGARDRGFHIMDTLDVTRMPSWARGEDGRVRDVNDFCGFARMMVKRFGKYVRHWEIENEPDLGFPSSANLSMLEAARYYVEVLKPASKAIREADPRAVVMAAGVTSRDLGTDLTFSREVFRLASDAFDVYPIHPYAPARFLGPDGFKLGPEESMFREKILKARGVMNEAGAPKPIWIGEVGWSLDVEAPYVSEYAIDHAEFMARGIILARSVPEVERIIWFKARGCLEKKRYEYGLWRDENNPLPAAVVYANLARVLHRVQPVRPLFESDVRAYAFQRDGVPLVALWKWRGEPTEMKADVRPGRVRIIDMIGNMIGDKVPPAGETAGVVIPLTESPVFVLGRGIATDALCRAIETASVAMDPVTVSVAYGDVRSIAGFVKNNLPRKVSGTVELVAPEGVAVAEPAQPLELSPTGSRTFRFALSLKDSALSLRGKEFRLRVETDSGSVVKRVPVLSEPCVKRSILLSRDSALAGWKGLPVMTLRERGDVLPPDPDIGWDGPEDLSATAHVAWDDEWFYFAARVRDDAHSQERRGGDIWKGDSIQIAFDTANDAQENRMRYDGNDFEYGLALTGGGPTVFRYVAPEGKPAGQVVKEVKAVIRREGDLTVYQAAFPWRELSPLSPVEGRMFGFNFTINDDDGTGRQYWMGLTPGIAEMKYPFAYKKFVLMKE